MKRASFQPAQPQRETAIREKNAQRETPLQRRRLTRDWVEEAVGQFLEAGKRWDHVTQLLLLPLIHLRNKTLANPHHPIWRSTWSIDSGGPPVSGSYQYNVKTEEWKCTITFGKTDNPQEIAIMKRIW